MYIIFVVGLTLTHIYLITFALGLGDLFQEGC